MKRPKKGGKSKEEIRITKKDDATLNRIWDKEGAKAAKAGNPPPGYKKGKKK